MILGKQPPPAAVGRRVTTIPTTTGHLERWQWVLTLILWVFCLGNILKPEHLIIVE